MQNNRLMLVKTVKMKTPFLDKKIQELEQESVFSSFTEYDNKKLEEYQEIKRFIKSRLANKCNMCNKNKSKKLHTCPYHEDINNDSNTLCNCCDECQMECAMSI